MDQHLIRIVTSTSSWAECKERVTRSYGETLVPVAEGIARGMRSHWFADEAPLEFRAEPVSDEPDDASEHASLNVRLPRVEVGRIHLEPIKVQVEAEATVAPRKRPIRRGQWRTDSILIAMASALAVALLFPPLQGTVQGVTVNFGFGFLFSPLITGPNATLVNIPLLLCELLVITAIGGAAWLFGRFD